MQTLLNRLGGTMKHARTPGGVSQAAAAAAAAASARRMEGGDDDKDSDAEDTDAKGEGEDDDKADADATSTAAEDTDDEKTSAEGEGGDDDEAKAAKGEGGDEDEANMSAALTTAHAVQAETDRVLAIVGSPAGLANPSAAVKLAQADEQGHRMSVARATSLLADMAPAQAAAPSLGQKLAGQTGALGPDGKQAQADDPETKRATAYEARKQRQSAASRA